VTLKPGVTITSSQYDVAYAGWVDSNGEFQTRVLSGSSDLQILDVTGVEGEDSVDESDRGTTANDSSDVVVYEGDSPPDPIAYPQDHSDWTILIKGASNQSTHSPTDVTVDGTTYTVPSTSLNAGEAVESVHLIPPVEYEQPVEHVADPSNPDDGDTAAQIQSLRETIDELEDSGGGGGGILPGFPDLGIGGMVGGVAAIGGAIYLAGQAVAGGGSGS
jgi:hypothetical protein